MLLTLCEYEPHRLADIFAPGLPLVNLLQYQLQGLVRQYLPKLAAHFDKHGIHPTMYAAQWMLTIFTYSFPFSVTCRVWDSFLLEGWKVVFRVGLAVLQHHEAALLALDMEGMLMYFPHMHEDLDGDALLAAAFKFSFRRRQLRALRAAFEAEHGPVTSPVQRMTTFEHRTAAVAQAVAEQSPTPLLPAKAKAVSPGPAVQNPALWTPAAAAAEAAKAHPPSTPVMVMSGGQVTLEKQLSWEKSDSQDVTLARAPVRSLPQSSEAAPAARQRGRAATTIAASTAGGAPPAQRGILGSVMRSFSGSQPFRRGSSAPVLTTDPGSVPKGCTPSDVHAVLVPGSPTRALPPTPGHQTRLRRSITSPALMSIPGAPSPRVRAKSRDALTDVPCTPPLTRPRSMSSADKVAFQPKRSVLARRLTPAAAAAADSE